VRSLSKTLYGVESLTLCTNMYQSIVSRCGSKEIGRELAIRATSDVHSAFVLSIRSVSGQFEVCLFRSMFVLVIQSLSRSFEVCLVRPKFVLSIQSVSCPFKVCHVNSKFVFFVRCLSS
jgi:hypothetical protein